MIPGLERLESVERLERLRDRLDGGETPPVGWPVLIREEFEPLLADEDVDDVPAVAEALRRLALLAEVWDCLDAEGTEAVGRLSGFFGEAIGRLASGRRRDDTDEACAWILRESSSRWGDYLTLIDPSAGPAAEQEDAPPVIPDDLSWPDNGPIISALELLQKLSLGADPVTTAALSSLPELPIRPTGSPGGDIPAAEVPPREPAPVAPEPARPDALAEARAIELDPELRGIFLADASDLFGTIQEHVLGLGDGEDARRLHELGRCFHTLKGASGSVGLTVLAAAIHDLEDDLEAAGGIAGAELVRRLEGSLSMIEGVLHALEDDGPIAEEPSGGEESSIGVEDPGSTRAVVGPEAGAESTNADGMIRMPASRFEELMDLCSEMLTRRRIWSDQADRMKRLAISARGCSQRLRGSVDLLDEMASAEPIHARRGRGGDPGELAGLVLRMSEQAEDLAALAATAREAAIPMATEAEDLSRLSLRLWDGLQSVRIVPVRGLFQRLVRVARDAARVENREIEVQLVGEETGADRLLLDKAYEPLLHVVRNAVGHGIEPPEDRKRAGKPAAGRITLEARREGNTVALSVQDDGRGLDYDAIAAKGRRLGLIGPDERPGVERLNGLIFHAGFSTRSQANAVSGRGVGMDVVAREVELLRGRIELTSQAGRGTRLAIRLPARIALEHMMVVRVRGQAFAVPTPAIDAVHRAPIVDRGGPDAGPAVAVEGRTLPMIDLGSVLGFSGTPRESCPTVLVVTSEAVAVALRVDGIDGPAELVIKPLGPLLVGHPAISGAGLSTGGEVIPALDVAGLLRLARSGDPSGVPAEEPGEERPIALVVDDSLSVRRVASRNLRSLGFEVDEASDGEEALGRLRLRSYRLIMTDLEMPRMDGFALLAELGRTGVLESTGVVVASTLTDAATRRRVLDLGALAFVPKPVDAQELAAAVGPLLVPEDRPGAGPGPRDVSPLSRPS